MPHLPSPIKLLSLATFLILGFHPNPVFSQNKTQKLCPAQLPSAIETIINRSELQRSRWGILIQTLDNQQTLYQREAQRYFTPASTVKLLTTAAALHHLGSAYRIRTSIYGTPNTANLSSLRLVGRGDPSLTNTQLQDLAQQLQRQGIESVEKLIVEDSYFHDPPINPTWQWEDLIFYYATAVNSLILNENTVTLTLLPQKVGQPVKLTWDDNIAARQWQTSNFAYTYPDDTEYSVKINSAFSQPWLQLTGNLPLNSEPDPWGMAIVNPGNYFLESWRRILESAGITVKQGIVSTQKIDKIEGEQQLAAIESLPLSQLLQVANQRSNNLYAEALLRTLGATQCREDECQSSTDIAKEILTDLGVEPSSYFLADGSGLSRQNLVSPEAIAQTLQLIMQTPQGEIYRNSLSLAGINGTLRRRFRDTPVQGNLWGKTGTLTGVTTLAGYLYTPNYQPMVISIMVNQSQQQATIHRQAIDEIVLLLTDLHPCEDSSSSLGF